MKKYKLLIIGIVVLLVSLLLLIIVFKDRLPFKEKSVKNTPEIESMVNISQSEMSTFVFATQESAQDHRIHVNFSPFLTIDVGENIISELYIENFKGESEAGEVLLIHPTSLSSDTVSRTFLFTDASDSMKSDTISSKGDSIKYEVVSEITKFNQVLNSSMVTPYFGFILKDIGSVNYEEIFERDNLFEGSKYLEYSGVDVNSLDTTIQFDIRIVFKDGKVYVKRFIGTLEGEKLETEISPLITLEKVEE
ncbi:MAG: hypothetical protein RBS01_01950 [Candidatus Dojkabacteria bacterium]|jgi:hypothetical protein|nr:hypothetical protein [Candidatus Dojkabacteria bacterium]